MLNKRFVIGLIVLLFLSCGVVSAFDLFGDGLEPEDIYIEGFDADVNDCSYDLNGEMEYDYMYSAFYTLRNVSSSLKGAEVVTYFYSNDDIIMSDEVYRLSNNTTTIINDDNSYDKNCIISAFAHSENLTNLTHVDIVVIKDGKVVFNESRNVTIKEVGKLTDFSDIEDSDSSDDKTSSDNYEATYVASSNSNKFHDPSCSQAKRINDANKITFSSRDEAVNAGYESCDICYP